MPYLVTDREMQRFQIGAGSNYADDYTLGNGNGAVTAYEATSYVVIDKTCTVIGFYHNTYATGAHTVSIKDASDNVLATATETLTATGLHYFEFDTPLVLYSGITYHFYVHTPTTRIQRLSSLYTGTYWHCTKTYYPAAYNETLAVGIRVRY
jgi:hypothetical protein